MPDINPPDIPYLARGGKLTRGGTVMVGDRGPERIDLPIGARVIPLNLNLDAKQVAERVAKVLRELQAKKDNPDGR